MSTYDAVIDKVLDVLFWMLLIGSVMAALDEQIDLALRHITGALIIYFLHDKV